MKSQIGHGAEAIVFRIGDSVLKERPKKEYRISQIDEKLRKTRTRKEAKILQALSDLGIPAPKLIKEDDKAMCIEMSFLSGDKVRDVLTPKMGSEIGRLAGLLHNNDIIHGDLTTSNMIVHDCRIHLIDFGLSFVSQKLEDKAVDIHLLKQAIESRHHGIHIECIKEIIKGYKDANPQAVEVLARLEVVESRGRNKK